MRLRSRMLLHIAAGLACAPGSGLAQAEAMKHDPFARPAFLRAAPPPNNAGVGKAMLPEAAWKPELAAVMVAGPKSAVNIDGTIIRLGEEINGHRLVEVHEQSAVFVKHRKRVTLSLRVMRLEPKAPPAPLAPSKPEEK